MAGIGAFLQRKSGRETASAAHRSADASQVAAQAAEASVKLNERVSTIAATRTEADSLGKRYQDAANQLGHEKAVVRMAGVIAMAQLADDWPQQRQMCVDVLCGYLRMSRSAIVGNDAPEHAEREVRATVLRLIAARTSRYRPSDESVVPSWSQCEFDLSGAVIYDLDWTGLTFERRVHLTGATFGGKCRIANSRFEYFGVLLDEVELEGSLEMYGIEARECGVTFDHATVRSAGDLKIHLSGSPAARWEMSQLDVEGRMEIHISPDVHNDSVVLRRADVRGDVVIHCGDQEMSLKREGWFDTPHLDFSGWNIHSGARVRIESQLVDVWSAEWQPRRVDPDADVLLTTRPAVPERS
ncbi:hypothetical protein [Lentzea sp. NPDC060358]|uniref:hypothetical protein n=1 Tax=Lentzea sp. NPDC060358 TaxID=3347103 RepID=UPI003652DC2A